MNLVARQAKGTIEQRGNAGYGHRMSRKQSDPRRFDFCTRCLQAFGPSRVPIEHHLYGRKNDHTAIVFICEDCHPNVENSDGPIEAESRALSRKRDLLFTSRALRWVIKNYQPIIDGFRTSNRNGVGQNGPGNWQPPFGAVGDSGRYYYFIPPDHLDEFIGVPTNPTWVDDCLAGPANRADWVRFMGTDQNILNEFLRVHRDEGSPGVDLEELRQR